MSEVESRVAAVREAALALRGCEPEEHEIPDAAGAVRELEAMLAEWRRRQEARFDDVRPMAEPEPRERVDPAGRAGRPVAQGKQWELVPRYKAVRVFNDERILHDVNAALSDMLGGAELGLAQTIRFLQANQAVTLGWRVTGLRRAAKACGLELQTGPVEADVDLTSPHIGEKRERAGYDRVPLKD